MGKGGGQYNFVCTSLNPQTAKVFSGYGRSDSIVIEFKKKSIPDEHLLYQTYSFNHEGDSTEIDAPQGMDMIHEGRSKISSRINQC